MWAVIIVLWLVLSVVVAFVAISLGRGPLLWFVISMLLSPGAAAAVLLIVWETQRLSAQQVTPTVAPELTVDEVLSRVERVFDQGKLRPDQLERLRTLAQREPPPANVAPVARTSVDEFTRPCPSCGRLISPKAAACMHCFAKVAAPRA